MPPADVPHPGSVEEALHDARTQHGEPLLDVTRAGPVLLVFLRHFGCALCRELVAQVARERSRIAAAGARAAFVHMHDEAQAAAYFAGYGVGDLARVSDPGQKLYAAFGLTRVSPTHWLDLRIIGRYIEAIVRGGHRPGYMGGDVLQMPGVFLVRDGAIVNSFRPERVSDRVDLVQWLS